jgi:hypothetical protein
MGHGLFKKFALGCLCLPVGLFYIPLRVFKNKLFMQQIVIKRFLFFISCAGCFLSATAQTDADAIMMSKKLFCVGFRYEKGSWDHYWEGTYKRDNANLGTVTTQMLGVMGNYGVSKKLNLLFNLPYVQTKASAGQMDGMQGVQDLSLWVKWHPVQQKLGNGKLSLFALGGYSLPASNYVADFLPMAIGGRSKTASVRGMADYQWRHWTATGSATYHLRSNITIDRQAYYTTEMHYTNEVKMPDAAQYQLRAGYRSNTLIAEAIVNHLETLGGFDITKNNMPFPSNNMDMTTAGVYAKYAFKHPKNLEVLGGANYVLAGRNAGQSTSWYGGVFYIFDFNKNKH